MLHTVTQHLATITRMSVCVFGAVAVNSKESKMLGVNQGELWSNCHVYQGNFRAVYIYISYYYITITSRLELVVSFAFQIIPFICTLSSFLFC